MANGMKEKLKQLLPDRLYMDLQFFHRYRRLRPHRSARTFQELLIRKKLTDSRCHRDLSRYADKYEVRKFVRQTVGERYLVPLHGVYDRAEDIDFTALPDSFVLKGAHGSAMNLLVADKASLDQEAARKMAAEWLATDYSLLHREWPYRSLKRRVIAEENLSDAQGNVPVDYKFFVFSGRVRLFEVDYGRFTNHVQAFFTPEGERLAVHRRAVAEEGLPPLPTELSEMVVIAERLGAGHEFIRVDLYNVDGRTYFGEMTFYPAAGLVQWKPIEFEYELGAVWLEQRPVAGKWILRK